jgi:hypothetical protein
LSMGHVCLVTLLLQCPVLFLCHLSALCHYTWLSITPGACGIFCPARSWGPFKLALGTDTVWWWRFALSPQCLPDGINMVISLAINSKELPCAPHIHVSNIQLVFNIQIKAQSLVGLMFSDSCHTFVGMTLSFHGYSSAMQTPQPRITSGMGRKAHRDTALKHPRLSLGYHT